MINGRLSDKLEGCLEFLEFGRHGRALDFTEEFEFHHNENLTESFKEENDIISQSIFDKKKRYKRTRIKLKPSTCNCEYVSILVFVIAINLTGKNL